MSKSKRERREHTECMRAARRELHLGPALAELAGLLGELGVTPTRAGELLATWEHAALVRRARLMAQPYELPGGECPAGRYLAGKATALRARLANARLRWAELARESYHRNGGERHLWQSGTAGPWEPQAQPCGEPGCPLCE